MPGKAKVLTQKEISDIFKVLRNRRDQALYPFESANEYSLDRLLPLRSVIEIEIADEEDMEAYAASAGTY